MGVRRLLPLFVTLVISCTDDDTVESPNTRATAVVVDPAEFLGSFPCGDFEGAPRSYRATVTALAQPATEDAEAREEKVIGVSERLDCATPVAFTEVEAGRRYVADIEVFDVPLDADEPEPAWTTSCGREGSPAQGRLLEQVVIRDCLPLTGAGTAVTAIAVDATKTAAPFGCVDDETPGSVDTLIVTNTTDGAPAGSVTIACGQDAVRFETEIEPGATYTFRIEAEDADGDVIAGATCEAVAREGIVVPAVCGQLSDRAEIVIPVVELLEEQDKVCGENATLVRVAVTAGPTKTDPAVLDCNSDVTIPGVLAGSYLASLEVLDGDAVVLAFSCTGTAPPGSRTTLVCTPED